MGRYTNLVKSPYHELSVYMLINNMTDRVSFDVIRNIRRIIHLDYHITGTIDERQLVGG